MREYEQNNLQREKEKELHALELKTQLDKISGKLKFENKKDLKGAIQKLEASIASDKELLDAKAAEQAKAEAAAAKLREQVTKVEQELGELKSALEAKAAEVKQQRKQLKQAAEALALALPLPPTVTLALALSVTLTLALALTLTLARTLGGRGERQGQGQARAARR